MQCAPAAPSALDSARSNSAASSLRAARRRGRSVGELAPVMSTASDIIYITRIYRTDPAGISVRSRRVAGRGIRTLAVRGAGTEVHVAALGLDTHPRLALAVAEFEARARPVVRLFRLRTEAIVDAAAEGLHVELPRGRGREIEAHRPTDRLAVEVAVGRERETRGQIPGDGAEAAARQGRDIDLGVAAHGLYFDVARAALELHVAVDGLDFGRLRPARGQVHKPRGRIRAQVAADLAGDIAADGAQIGVALETLHL